MSGVTVRRARPWLGTIVDVMVRAGDVAVAQRAVEAAFHAIERVHRLMSPVEKASDVAAINRIASGETLAVSRETFTVLVFCERLHRASQGLFDPCRADGDSATGRWAALALDHEGTGVRVGERVRLDLGGVAKGYAVDAAVHAARAAGACGGLVNAGGDLRVWGDAPVAVHIRNPIAQVAMRAGALGYGSLATSALGESDYYNPLLPDAPMQFISATVTAPDCMTADALTKVVLASPQPPLRLLAKFNAAALVIARDGSVLSTRVPLLPPMHVVDVFPTDHAALEINHA